MEAAEQEEQQLVRVPDLAWLERLPPSPLERVPWSAADGHRMRAGGISVRVCRSADALLAGEQLDMGVMTAADAVELLERTGDGAFAFLTCRRSCGLPRQLVERVLMLRIRNAWERCALSSQRAPTWRTRAEVEAAKRRDCLDLARAIWGVGAVCRAWWLLMFHPDSPLSAAVWRMMRLLASVVPKRVRGRDHEWNARIPRTKEGIGVLVNRTRAVRYLMCDPNKAGGLHRDPCGDGLVPFCSLFRGFGVVMGSDGRDSGARRNDRFACERFGLGIEGHLRHSRKGLALWSFGPSSADGIRRRRRRMRKKARLG